MMSIVEMMLAVWVSLLVLLAITTSTTSITPWAAATRSRPSTTPRPDLPGHLRPTASPQRLGQSRAPSPPPTKDGDSGDQAYNCPVEFCTCYVVGPRRLIWLNCTLPRLQGTEQQRALFRTIPARLSALITVTCFTPARSYLYDDMVPHLSSLIQLEFINCKFHDIPRNVFRGLSLLEMMRIEGANLLGHVDPQFASHLPKLHLLEILQSRVTFLPPLCGSTNLRTLNVSYNHIADLDHAGVNCVSRPLTHLQILDVNYNRIASLPPWLGDSLPNLLRLSSGTNAISQVDQQFCEKLPDLKYLDLTENLMSDVHRVQLYNCSQLRIVGLGQNDLGALPPGSLESMMYVQNLYLFSMGLSDEIWSRIGHMEFLNFLELQNNSLHTLPPDVLRGFPNLLTLNLSLNSITTLPKTALTNQHRLQVLDLSSNGLLSLPFLVFSSLRSLQELRLSNNSLTDLDPMSLTGLRALVKLDLSHNSLRVVPEQAFATVSSLRTLDLRHNRLTDISATAFLRMGSLVRVLLGNNRLRSVPSMSGLLSVEEVDLSDNNLTSLSASMFTALHNLTRVVLRGNAFSSLSVKTFQDCRSLQYLDLSHNRLLALTPAHFLNVGSLQHLDLSHNAFDSMGPRLKSVRTLLLAHNRLHKVLRGDVSASLQVLDLSHNQISHISPFTFAVALNIRKVDLTYNELTSLSANTMEISFSQAQYSQPLVFLKGNPLRCDCDLGWLKDWSLDRIPSSVVPLPDFGDLDDVLCHSLFVGSNRTTSTPLTEVNRSEFLCSYDRKCGEGCLCCGFDMCYCNSVCPKACTCYIGDGRLAINRVDCANADFDFLPEKIPEAATEIFLDGNNLGTLESLSFLGHGQTTTLRLNNSDIHHIENNTFRGMNSLRKLHLDHNSLTTIYVALFRDLEKLEVLHLQDNEISFIEEGAFGVMQKLQVVNLERNRLVTLSFEDFVSLPSLTSLRLRGNPLTCAPTFTCSFFQFLTNSSVIKDLKRLLCYDYDMMAIPDDRSVNGTPILNLPLAQCGVNLTEVVVVNATRPSIQKASSTRELSILIVVCVLSVLVISAMVVIYINRHLLEVWCFTKFGWRVFKMAPGGKEDEDRPYDAFVSYSHMDEEFVVQELAPRLENGYKRFKLCLHYRDFPVGASIAETIVRSVESSQRTIILVSSNFLGSEWCRFEFQTAHQQVLTERKNRVILVLLHDVEESQLDQTLKLYMRSRTYLKYDDPWFWEKLMFAMPDKKAEKFERLPSTRDLEYVARFGRSPSKTPSSTPAVTPRHGHANYATARGGDVLRPDMYEVPVENSATYERVNESMSICSSLYNGGSLGAGSGHYEEVTPRAFVMRPMHDVCTCQNPLPPPLPPLPRMGLMSHEEVKNSPRHSSREVLAKEENWV